MANSNASKSASGSARRHDQGDDTFASLLFQRPPAATLLAGVVAILSCFAPFDRPKNSEIPAKAALVRDLLDQVSSPSPMEPTPDFYLDLSLQCFTGKRYAEAIAAAQAAIDLKPDYAEAWNNMGAAYNSLGSYDKAIPVLEKALKFKPDLELARNNLAYAREMAAAAKPPKP